MLHTFLATHRATLIDRCALMVAHRSEPKLSDSAFSHGIPIFLDQIIWTLQIEQTGNRLQSEQVSGLSGSGGPSEIGIVSRVVV